MKKISISLAVLLSFIVTNVAYAAPLSAPSNLVATAVSSLEIDLTWTDNSNKEAGFEIERSTDGTNYSYHDEVGAGITSYGDISLTENTTYYYQVRAFNYKKGVKQYGGFSNTANDTTFSAVPDAPSGLTATSMAPDSTPYVSVTWTDNSTSEDYFDVERSLNGVDYSALVTVSANVTSYDDTTVTPAVTYYYRVKARNTTGSSSYSNTDSVLVVLNAPSAPSGLTATSMAPDSTPYVSVTWTDNSTSEDYFDVERSLNGVDYSALVTVSANVTSYDDTTVTPAVTYYYRVKARNTTGSSSYSNTDSVLVVLNAPSAPSNLSLIPIGTTTPYILVMWSDNSQNEDYFDLERSTDGVNFSPLYSITENTIFYDDYAVTSSVTYYYRVKARNSTGSSIYSNIDSETAL